MIFLFIVTLVSTIEVQSMDSVHVFIELSSDSDILYEGQAQISLEILLENQSLLTKSFVEPDSSFLPNYWFIKLKNDSDEEYEYNKFIDGIIVGGNDYNKILPKQEIKYNFSFDLEKDFRKELFNKDSYPKVGKYQISILYYDPFMKAENSIKELQSNWITIQIKKKIN